MDADRIRREVFHGAISDEQWERIERRVKALPWRDVCHPLGIFDVTGLKESMRIAIAARVVASEIKVDGLTVDSVSGEQAVMMAGVLLQIMEQEGIERHMPDRVILEKYAEQEASKND